MQNITCPKCGTTALDAATSDADHLSAFMIEYSIMLAVTTSDPDDDQIYPTLDDFDQVNNAEADNDSLVICGNFHCEHAGALTEFIPQTNEAAS